MLATLLLHLGRWGRRARLLVAPLLVLPFAWALLAWGRAHTFTSADLTWVANAPANRLKALQYAWPILPQMLVVTLMFMVAVLGYALFPLAAGLLKRRTAKRAAPVLAAFAVIWLAGTYGGVGFWVPLAPGETWAIDELGATAALVPEWRSAFLFPRWAGWITTAIGLGLGSILLVEFPWHPLREREKFVVWTIAGQCALMSVLWLFYDRYGLVLVPLAVVLILARQPALRIGPAACGVIIYASLSIIGVRDHLAYNAALWNAVAQLQAMGTPASELDAGYIVNGWLQYLHPERAHRAPDGHISIPMINEDPRLAYTVANRPREGATVVKTVPYSGWLRPSGMLYILKQ
jgi:hypothetical protein